ncbi:rho guanine nucleotide exchange factor 16-like isoform X2 [Clytia hemisphaerica]|uniref:rho guanine nucleotide exchange factor 16-like isoform X2 n=1 Tax=Clytia hemisphaerica TaxID=252671 RepID=UPI0034D476D3
MADQDQGGGVSIASRIKQFSSPSNTSQLDSNSNNITHKKPNPAPRKRPQTTEVSYNVSINNNNENKSMIDRKSVNRSTSSPITQRKPLVPTKPGAPKPTSPKPRPIATNNSNSNDKTNKTRRTSGEKPVIPIKPSHISPPGSANSPNRPSNTLSSTNLDNTKLATNNTPTREKSWKQVVGPPKAALPTGPSQETENTAEARSPSPVPLKPLRGVAKVITYEDNTIDPSNNKIVSTNSSNRSQCRRETLDGQMILGGAVLTSVSRNVKLDSSYINTSHKSARSSRSAPITPYVEKPDRPPPPPPYQNKKRLKSANDADEESYDYPYEPSLNLQRKFQPPSSSVNQNNTYEQADPAAMRDFVSAMETKKQQQNGQVSYDSQHSSDDNYDLPPDDLYQDPETANFNQAPPPIPRHLSTTQNKDSDSDSDIYDEPPDELYQDPESVNFHKAPIPKPPKNNNNNDNKKNNKKKGLFNFNKKTKPTKQPSIDDMDDGAYQDPDEASFHTQPPSTSAAQQKPSYSTCQSTDDDMDDLYQDPEEIDFNTAALLNSKNTKPQLQRCDSNYDSPLEDYDEPPLDARCPVAPSHRNQNADSSDDDDVYDFPDSEPPQIPNHKKSSEIPPVIPHHKKSSGIPPAIPIHKKSTSQEPDHSENNLHSSSSDEDDSLDYNDPETFFAKPPALTNLKNGGRLASLRRGSNALQPLEYMPASEFTSSMDDADDDLYCDPETSLTVKPPSFYGRNSDGEEIYSDEPLYQVYNKEVINAAHRESKKKDDEVAINHLKQLTEDLMHKGSTMRILWSELPSVRNSGFLDNISPDDRKRQEAMFEVITSEASYLKSLDILISHFMLNRDLLPNPNHPSHEGDELPQLLDRQQYHFLFSGLSAIKGVSERFLKDLRKRQQSSILMDSISDILLDYASNHLTCYVKYCSNQVFQDRTFQHLLDTSPAFVNKLSELEKDPITQGLSLQSFLTLPMQRITRLPLLVDAICRRCTPASEEFEKTDTALKALNAVVKESNEGARQMVRTEEMYFIQKNLIWKTKPIPLISTSRWLVKKGDLMCLHEEGRFSQFKNQLRQIFKGKFKPIYIFLFTDIVLVTKMKGEDKYKVIDVCQRSSLRCEIMKNIPDPEPPKMGTLATMNVNPLKYAFTLILLENANGKTVDYHFFLSTETDKTRWMEALSPPKSNTPTVEGESIYEEWDCPQVQAIHQYVAQQPDELTLMEGDVISVLRKLPDGWAEGMLLRDDTRGWFPINHTDEIDSRHMRAKNLMQRYRLITASKNVINEILGK